MTRSPTATSSISLARAFPNVGASAIRSSMDQHGFGALMPPATSATASYDQYMLRQNGVTPVAGSDQVSGPATKQTDSLAATSVDILTAATIVSASKQTTSVALLPLVETFDSPFMVSQTLSQFKRGAQVDGAGTKPAVALKKSASDQYDTAALTTTLPLSTDVLATLNHIAVPLMLSAVVPTLNASDHKTIDQLRGAASNTVGVSTSISAPTLASLVAPAKTTRALPEVSSSADATFISVPSNGTTPTHAEDRFESQLVERAVRPAEAVPPVATFGMGTPSSAFQPSIVQSATQSAYAPPVTSQARDDAQYHQIAREIQSINDGTGNTSFRLSPENIGQLDVRLTSSTTGLSIHMNASHEHGRSLLNQYQPQLIKEIRAQGVRVSESNLSSNFDRNSDPQSTPRRNLAVIETAAPQPADPATSTTATVAGRFA